MRIFITGASGYIGNAVAKAFRNAGHCVRGLVRSEEAAQSLWKNEIEPVIDDLTKPEIFAAAIRESNVFIHCAFEKSKDAVAKDAKALEAIIGFSKENDLPKVFIYTSGIWVYGPTGSKIADESSPLQPIDLVKWRPYHEDMVLKAASKAVKPVVIRPGLVFGGSGGLTSLWFESSQKGPIALYGDGSNHFAMIHVEDLAMLYVAAAEKELGPIVLNAVDTHSPTAKECVEAIAKYLRLHPAYRQLSEQESHIAIGPLSQGFLLDQKISAERAYRLLGWLPKHPGFVEGISNYFEAWRSHLPKSI